MHAYPIIDIVTLCGSEASQEHCFNQLVYMYLVKLQCSLAHKMSMHVRQNKSCSLWHLTLDTPTLNSRRRSPLTDHDERRRHHHRRSTICAT